MWWGGNGFFLGNPGQLLVQFDAVLTVWIYAGAATWIILKVVDVTVGLRVAEEEEEAGLDIAQHGEVAYRL